MQEIKQKIKIASFFSLFFNLVLELRIHLLGFWFTTESFEKIQLLVVYDIIKSSSSTSINSSSSVQINFAAISNSP
ncbi:hypothetical protein HanPSC8_Chr06g0256011 [Helianthus annuus]|nr:hypothetical protein HanPSC8_Chr06g0256011 [Helianthus annuus]